MWWWTISTQGHIFIWTGLIILLLESGRTYHAGTTYHVKHSHGGTEIQENWYQSATVWIAFYKKRFEYICKKHLRLSIHSSLGPRQYPPLFWLKTIKINCLTRTLANFTQYLRRNWLKLSTQYFAKNRQRDISQKYQRDLDAEFREERPRENIARSGPLDLSVNCFIVSNYIYDDKYYGAEPPE